MSNENSLEQFLNSVGAVVELWTVTYKDFRAQGFNEREAILHTKELMETMLKSSM